MYATYILSGLFEGILQLLASNLKTVFVTSHFSLSETYSLKHGPHTAFPHFLVAANLPFRSQECGNDIGKLTLAFTPQGLVTGLHKVNL